MEIKTLEQAKRAAFMGAYRGLRHQGWQQSRRYDGCAYRGDDGRNCAVGWLLRDVPAWFNGLSFYGLTVYFKWEVLDALATPLGGWLRDASSDDFKRFVEFLGELQSSHDCAETPGEMEQAFERVRVENDWPVPSA